MAVFSPDFPWNKFKSNTLSIDCITADDCTNLTEVLLLNNIRSFHGWTQKKVMWKCLWYHIPNTDILKMRMKVLAPFCLIWSPSSFIWSGMVESIQQPGSSIQKAGRCSHRDCYHKVTLQLHHCHHLSGHYEFFSVLQITLYLVDILQHTQTQQTINHSDCQRRVVTQLFHMSTYLLCFRSILATRSTRWQRCFVIKHLALKKFVWQDQNHSKTFNVRQKKLSFPNVFPNQKHKIHCTTGNQFYLETGNYSFPKSLILPPAAPLYQWSC